MVAAPSIDVLVPSRDRHASLRTSLPTWERALKRVPTARLIICDQSAVPFQHDTATVLHRPACNGLPAARNILLRASSADVVLFLDDDTSIAADFLSTLQQHVIDESDILAWGPVVESRPRTVRRLHRMLQLGAFRDQRRLLSRRCDALSSLLFGCCFAVRRSAAQAIGFDSRRAGYALGEDADFFARLHRAHGEKIRARFCRDLRAWHRRDGGNRATPHERGLAKGAFIRWWGHRHGDRNPVTPLHIALALVAAGSGRGAEPASSLAVFQGFFGH